MFFFFQAEDGIRDVAVTGVQTCALPIFSPGRLRRPQPKVVRALRRHEWLPLRRRVDEGRQVDVPGWVSVPRGSGSSRNGDTAPARGQPQRVHGGSGRSTEPSAPPPPPASYT